MSSWRAKDVISQKHASSQHRHTETAQWRRTWPGLHFLSWFVLSCPSLHPSLFSHTFWARPSVEFLHLLFLPHNFTPSATFQVQSLHCSSYHHTPSLVSLGDHWSLVVHHLYHLGFLLFSFLRLKEEAVTWQMVELHGWHLGYISLRFS